MIIICENCPCYNYERDFCGLFFDPIKWEKIDGDMKPVSKTCELVSVKSSKGEHRPTKRAVDTATPYEYEVVLHNQNIGERGSAA